MPRAGGARRGRTRMATLPALSTRCRSSTARATFPAAWRLLTSPGRTTRSIAGAGLPRLANTRAIDRRDAVDGGGQLEGQEDRVGVGGVEREPGERAIDDGRVLGQEDASCRSRRGRRRRPLTPRTRPGGATGRRARRARAGPGADGAWSRGRCSDRNPAPGHSSAGAYDPDRPGGKGPDARLAVTPEG